MTDNIIDTQQIDILNNHDFLLFKTDKKTTTKTIVDDKITKNKIILSSYQSFVNSFVSIHTPNNKLLLNFTTGSGKTIASSYTTIKFLESSDDARVIILGFTKFIFRDEMARYVDFGILNAEEIEQYKNNRNDLSLVMKINKRIANKNIHFFGYQEFFNKLFLANNLSTANMSKNELIELIGTGKVQINIQVLKMFKRSLIICDEFHNLYNSLEQNNWGTAIEFILDYYTSDRIKREDPLAFNSVKVLFLSATPITHNAIEIVYVLNMLNDKKDKIKRADLFNGMNLKESADSIIKKLTYGKVSYINTNSTENFPTKEIVGEPIEGIKHIKFIRCEMSYFYYNTYKFLSTQKMNKMPNKSDKISYINYLESEEIKKELKLYKVNLSLNNKFFMDYVIPNPNSEDVGLYDAIESKRIIKEAPQKWKQEKGIDLNKNNTFVGPWLDYENIKTYSSKYYNLLTYIFDIIKNKKGKMMIFHPYVVYSGTYFISELLKYNGMIDVDDLPNKNTLCSICGIKNSDHPKSDDAKKFTHEFKPAKFILIHGDMNKRIIGNMISRYNEKTNCDGDDIKIIIGSTILKDSFTIYDTQHLFITHLPVSISTMVQIIGRVVRNNSHKNLPPDQRHVNIYILVHCFSGQNKQILTFEEMYYKRKMNEFLTIDHINSLLVNNAVDYHINQDINNYSNAIFDEISYSKMPKKINVNNSQALTPYFIQKELDIIKYMIKRLFIEKYHIWKYEDLFEMVKTFPYKVEINPKFILEDRFLIALNELVFNKNNMIYTDKVYSFGETIMNDISNEIIFLDKNNEKVVIKAHNNYYYLIKYDDRNNEYILDKPYNMAQENTISINIDNIISDIDIDYELILIKMLRTIHTSNINPLYKFEYIIQQNALKYLIETPKIQPSYKELISIYNKYGYILYKDKKIIGHCLDTKFHHILSNNKWEEKIILQKQKLDKQDIISFHALTGNLLSFKILDNNIKRVSKDKRTILSGVSCSNLDNLAIGNIFNKLKVNMPEAKNKSLLCDELEDILITKKNSFYNLYTYSNIK